MRRRVAWTMGIGLVSALTACVIVSSSGIRLIRPEVLSDTAELVIVPGYRELQVRAFELHASADALCATPTGSALDDAQAAFLETSRAYETTLAWGFGPAIDRNLEGELDFWPTRPATIEANIASSTPITGVWIDELGVAAKGLPAIEYLLFAGGDPEVLTALADERRCAYLAALAAHVDRKAGALVSAWEDEWATELATAGRGSSAYDMEADGFSALVTQLLASVQRLKLTKLGGPLGVTAGGAPQPDAVELPYASASIVAMTATLEGVRRVWSGVEDGDSLSDAVRARDAVLAARVDAEIEAALAALRAVPEPLAAYVVSDDLTAALAAHEALRVLERTLASDVADAIAISVAFTDSDGD